MGDTEKRGADESDKRAERRERDARVLRFVQSENDAEKAEGWILVEEIYRRPVAKVVRRIALRGFSPALEILLLVNLQLNYHVFEEIWAETIECLFQNVQKEGFRFKGNLLAYLTKIALRLTMAKWCKEQKYESIEELPGLISVAEIDDDGSELGEHIRRFYHGLKKQDKVAFWIGMRLAAADLSKRDHIQVFVQKIKRGNVWSGEDSSIVRRYHRLRERLRSYLRRQGYNA